MMKGAIPELLSRKAALLLNAVIVSAYLTIAVFAPTPWVMFGGFLLVALVIRCATLCWMTISEREITGNSARVAVGIVAWNLLLGIVFSATLLGFLWWLGHFWLSGIKILVPLIAVLVAYKSTFPVVSWKPKSKAGAPPRSSPSA